MAKWKVSVWAAVALTVVVIPVASAQPLDAQMIQTIKDTAASICNTIKEAKGQKSDTQIQGDINAALAPLIAKIANASVSGKVTITQEQFDGLSRDATAVVLQGDRDCRERLFNKMFDALSAAAALQADEDLRVSFRFDLTAALDIKVAYILRNLGKQAELISRVALLEIVVPQGNPDPEQNLSLCDNVQPATLQVLTSPMQQVMGPGFQVGNDTKNTSIYYPATIAVDGLQWLTRQPISIESGKTRLIEASFKFSPDHVKDQRTVVFCPLVAALDIRNVEGAAVCEGQATTQNGNGFSQSTTLRQFRVLPHSKGIVCPVVP